MPAENNGRTHLNRRQALRIGGAIGAAVAGIAAALRGPGSTPAQAQAQASPWRMMHLEIDAVVDPATAATITQAGGGPPQTGDWFSILGKLYDVGRIGGPQIGVYQCMGAWTAAPTDPAAPDWRLTVVQYRFSGRGAIMGVINEQDANGDNLVGAVSGGTGEFAGALGTFRQPAIAGSVAGVSGGEEAFHPVFDLFLPNVGSFVSQSGQ